jgi:excisionase family DNA binding protein
MTAPKRKPRDDTSVWVDPNEGAKITGLNVQTIRRLCREEKLAHIRLGRSILIPRSALTPDSDGVALDSDRDDSA